MDLDHVNQCIGNWELRAADLDVRLADLQRQRDDARPGSTDYLALVARLAQVQTDLFDTRMDLRAAHRERCLLLLHQSVPAAVRAVSPVPPVRMADSHEPTSELQ